MMTAVQQQLAAPTACEALAAMSTMQQQQHMTLSSGPTRHAGSDPHNAAEDVPG